MQAEKRVESAFMATALPTTQNRAAQLETVLRGIIRGNDSVVRTALVAVFARGHLLIEGVPGVGKTTLAQALARALDCEFQRIQFTSDMLPSDVLGISMYSVADQRFEFKRGPVFTNVLLADEINRTTPKTQSALLEAMNEGQITVDAHCYQLPQPFLVVATQNPVEHHGTYPLPESQLDRFLMRVHMGYPDRDAERRIVFETTGAEEIRPKPAMTAEDLMAAQRLVRRLPVGESVVEAILALVRSARPSPEADDTAKLIAWGPSPRASQALMLAVRARALLEGRFAPSVDDVVHLAEPVLKHRMALTFAARADGESVEAVIGRLRARFG